MPAVTVFLGPSLDLSSAREILEADYLPPAKRGDIPAAVVSGSRVIGLIDGVFFQDCSVGHREILDAIRSGVRVVGASSMGALRAAELCSLGMEGVGEVFRLYRDGIIDSDDEVALSFDPLSLAPVSEPLVNIRCTLASARKMGLISREEEDYILSRTRSLYFPDRTWERILDLAKDRLGNESFSGLSGFIAGGGRDIKREDAVAALHRIKEIASSLSQG
jgi:hypothetical protein